MVTHKYKCRFCGKEFKYRTPDFIFGCDHVVSFIPAMHIVFHHGRKMSKVNWKDFFKLVALAVVEIALVVVLLPIFLLTYPFWWLHEELF